MFLSATNVRCLTVAVLLSFSGACLANSESCLSAFASEKRQLSLPQIRPAISDGKSTSYEDVFSHFVLENNATRDNMKDLAKTAFLYRLNWSVFYDERFVAAIEDTWEPRLQGVLKRGRGAYSKPQPPFMTNPEKYFTTPDGLSEKIPLHYHKFGPMRVRRFLSPIDKVLGVSEPYFFVAFLYNEPARAMTVGRYIYSHAHAEDVPRIMDYLAQLWAEVVGAEPGAREITSADADKRLRKLAEFEWIYYRTNPFGRGGATTGKVLSLVLQKHLLELGIINSIDQKFIRHDQLAMDQAFEIYVESRIRDFIQP